MTRTSEILEGMREMRDSARDARRTTTTITTPADKAGAKLGSTKKVGTISEGCKMPADLGLGKKENVQCGQEGEI